MSGGRQTGTVPKTKHNSRARRENQVNHIPNNLDWHETFTPQRVRKESNTNSRLSNADDDGFIYEENPWMGLAPSNRTDDDELRWSNVKTSNITPERGNTASNADGFIAARAMQREESNGPEERGDMPSTSKEPLSRGRLKLKMEQSQRKLQQMEALQQTQAALLGLRNKAIQQVKPVQIEEMQQHSGLFGLRNKPVGPVQARIIANTEARLQTMREYANIMEEFERDETTANLVEQADLVGDQQLQIKLNELLAKKAQCDNILACMESENIPGVAASVSSDDGETSQFSQQRQGFNEVEDSGSRRDLNKQDNRELEHHAAPSASHIHQKELKLEEVKNKLEQLQTLLNRVESLREAPPQPRLNGDASHAHEHQPTCKNCPPNSVLEKLHTKKIDLDQDMRKIKTFQSPQAAGFHFNPPQVAESCWASSVNDATANSMDYSSEEGEVEYDESPVKLCSTGYLPSSSFPKASTNGHPPGPKVSSVGGGGTGVRGGGETGGGGGGGGGGAGGGGGRRPASREPRGGGGGGRATRPQEVVDLREIGPTASALADQISELQMQMEQMQLLCQGMLEKQQVANFNSPQSWMPPQPNLGFMQFMSPPTPHWHQHQLLINSLNQCCQLIWHQQRELAGLRQALAMVQDESRMYKCGGYGNNLNFDPSGLLWAAQTSPQTLNNQVPPGNRANNYWDNFRSYSRQNLLSGRNKSNEGSIAESLPAARPPQTVQTDNLRRRKENHSLASNQVNGLLLPEENSDSANSCRSRRRYNSNLKADATAVFSLEQSIYSELETVIAQAERSPQVLLQLLTQLKNLRSQRPGPYEDGNPGYENECELLEHGIPSFPNISPRIDEPRNPVPEYRRKYEGVLEDVARLLDHRQDSELCGTEAIAEVVGYLSRTLALEPTSEMALHTSLAKFKGSRLRSVTDNLLLTVVRVLNNQTNAPAAPPTVNAVEELGGGGVEQIEEEGAVGGVPLPQSFSHQQAKSSSVEAELAEADQTPCNSTDNVEVFGIETGLPDVEQDNLELPPREENHELPLQEP